MDVLLTIAIVAITIAVLVQAGVLIAMYLMSRQLGSKAESLMSDSRRLVPPLELVANNLKTATDDLTETARITREQALHFQGIVGETHATVRRDIEQVRERVIGKVDQAGDVFMRPIRQYSALAMGIAEGVRTFFFGPKRNGT